MTAWHELSPQETLDHLRSDAESGLTEDEVARRQQEHGPNELVQMPGRSPWRIVWEQLSSAMVALLVAAALVSLYLAEYTDAIAILAIILLNAALGFFQDYRAERALASLKQYAAPVVKVRRNGRLRQESAATLVPGDIVLLEAGNLVPADCRLIEAVNLTMQESTLTGESTPVEKSTAALSPGDTPLGDRHDMAYMGAATAYGHGLGVVTATGMETELGQIAHSLQTVEEAPTPLQRRLAQLGRTLAILALAIVGLVFLVGMVSGESPRLMLLTALSLAVAIVPEGLPAVATVALALGAQRMFRHNALIRRLPAVETLGSVTVICSDKTGTLTENEMSVAVIEVDGHRVELAELDDGAAPDDAWRAADALLLAAALCSDAELADPDADAEVVGEPTEAALVLAAAQRGLRKPRLARRLPRVGEAPFDSERKRMATLHELPDDAREEGDANVLAMLTGGGDASHVVLMKGAVEAVLEVCTDVWSGGRAAALDESRRRRLVEAGEALAADGMRVLAVAFRPTSEHPGEAAEDLERDMTLLGLVGLLDPPRAEAADAVARCRTAGIRPLMITGDHPLTALSIARQTGIADGDRVLAGEELASMTVDDLAAVVADVSVYARVAPRDKLHIVQALQKGGGVVAMTGDGVNDAPALKQAHIGVAMGLVGADVSKEASDMVLLDDNFATIVNAVEQGRIVYDNIRKFVRYTMSSNAGEVFVMAAGPLLGMPLPLLPLQILWINLVTDGLPGLALALEPPERDTMSRAPYAPDEHIMGRGMWRDIAWVGVLMAAASLLLGYVYWAADAENEARWRTVVFTVLTLSQMGNVLALRSARDSLFRLGLWSNKPLVGAVALTFALQMAVVYFPPLQGVFKTTALSGVELLACLLLSTVVFWAVEAKKFISRRTTSAE